MRKQVCIWCSVLLLAAVWAAPVAAQDRAPNVRHREMTLAVKQGDPGKSFVISDAVPVPIERAEPFLAVGIAWFSRPAPGNDDRLSLRSSVDGVVWSEWLPVDADSDSMNEGGERVSVLLLLDQQTRFVQYRIANDAQGLVTVSGLRMAFISPGATPPGMQENIQRKMREVMSAEAVQQSKYPKPPVVTRTEWGCPDGQITTHGNLSYTTVTHLIVHHTFSPSTATNNDWAALVRSIWNFHVFSNGWADIGYNYVIDQNGVIYEGRAGGDNVVGAHFSGVNGGTMGVVIIGDFTALPPPASALNSLKRLLAWKADQRGIDPTGQSRHAASGLTLNNISGHRDGPGATECPGDAFYPLLPNIRVDVKTLLAEISSVTSVSAASFSGTSLASDSIVAAFGEHLASSIQVGSSTPLPTTLAGTTVSVRDSANMEKVARLFFVSPQQINFLMPAGLASGPATILIVNGDGKLAAGSVNIATIAPSLFAANANGRGVPAANLLRVRQDGSYVYEPVAYFDSIQNQFVAVPVDPGSENAGEQVFLVVYGTGIRGRGSLGSLSAKIGGVDAEVLFAGAAEGFYGLDQVNLRLPRALAGRGEVDLELVVDGVKANSLKLQIK